MMNKLNRVKGQKGFTLLEMVIVLGITGLIFGGLWGLISGSGGQLQAQTAAQQYRQVIEAARRLLAPGVVMGSFDPTDIATYPVGTGVSMPLSLLVNAPIGLLSPNFAQENGGNYYDAFGHQIRLQVQRVDAGDTSKWRFMVYSTPGTGVPGISDKIGAQVASLIGSEGGFVYSTDTEGCLFGSVAAANKTCGAFNSFAFQLSQIGVGNGSGRIATLSYTADSSLTGAPWLARKPYYTTDLNTAQANIDFQGPTGYTVPSGQCCHLFMRGNQINMGGAETATTGGGAININGGAFNMRGGTINMNAPGSTTGGGVINMATGRIINLGGPYTPTGSPEMTGNAPVMSFRNLSINTVTSLDIVVGSSVNMRTTGATGTVTLDINGTGRANTFQAGQFIYTSDMRLKENIRPIPNALDKVLKLRGMNYEWRSNHAKDVGLVAQDVEKVFPELVSHQDGVKGIDYAKLIAPLVEAVRQLKQDNDALRAKVDALEAAQSH